jgi:hypothetical protein
MVGSRSLRAILSCGIPPSTRSRFRPYQGKRTHQPSARASVLLVNVVRLPA